MKKILLFVIILTYFFISVGSATRESLTYDETVHMQVGMDAWNKKIFTADPYSPPLIGELASIPAVLGASTLISGQMPSVNILPSRMVIVLLSILLIFGVYHVVKRLIGEPEALASVFLFVWEPTILSHNHYVTKDMGFTVLFFFCYFFFLYVVKQYTWKRLVIFSVLFGLTLASKTSALPFFLVSVGTLCLFDRPFLRHMKTLWKQVLVGVAAASLVVWGCYFFQTDVLIARRDDPNRISSRLMQQAQKTNNTTLSSLITFGTDIRIPLGTYLASQKNALLLQRDRSPVFFQGSEYPHVRWYFMVVNLLLKLPIPLIILAGYLIYERKKETKRLRDSQVIFFVAPLLGILVFLCLSGVRPYVRYALPIYPFLIILSGIGLTRMIRNKQFLIPLALCMWYTVSTLLYFPHFISFANGFAGGRDTRYEKFIDSDIDWGQGLTDVASYIKTHDISTFTFSYFGTDDGTLYGLQSSVPYGTYKKEEICAFHEIIGKNPDGNAVTAISLSNWYYCGYYKMDEFKKSAITGVLGDTILLFSL